jgi:hypothetical protein
LTESVRLQERERLTWSQVLPAFNLDDAAAVLSIFKRW